MTFLLIWFAFNCINFGILGRILSIEMKENKNVDGGGYLFMFFLSLLLGPLLTAFLFGLFYKEIR